MLCRNLVVGTQHLDGEMLLVFRRVESGPCPDPCRSRYSNHRTTWCAKVLGIFAVKVRRLFRPDLEFAQSSGKLGVSLWAFLVAWAHLHDADIQFLEGLNSKIKIASNRAARIDLSTLSQRMRVQTHMAPYTASAAEKLAKARDVVGKMKLGSQGYPDAPIRNRWSSPEATPADKLPRKEERAAAMLAAEPWLRIDPARKWATAFSLVFNRSAGRESLAHCYTIGPMHVGSRAWVVVSKANKEKAWATSILCNCTIAADRLEENRRKKVLTVDIPLSSDSFGCLVADQSTSTTDTDTSCRFLNML